MADSPIPTPVPAVGTSQPGPLPMQYGKIDTSVTGMPSSGLPTPSSTTTTTTAITPKTTNSTQPTIPATSVTGSQQLNLPPTTPPSSAAPVAAVQGKAAGMNASFAASQGALLGVAQDQQDQAQGNYNATGKSVSDMIGAYLGKGDTQLAMENAAGIPAMRQLASQLTTQYTTQQLAYNAQYNEILNTPGATMEQKAQQIATLQQQHGYDLADTAIRQSLAQTNYTAAQDLINHQIDIKYGPLKDAIGFGMTFLQNNKDILTASQQRTFSAALQVQQQDYSQGIYYDHLLSDTKVQMVKDAQNLGAPPDVVQNIWNAGSIGSAAAAGSAYINGQDYTPVQTGVDDRTGLPIYSVKDSGGNLQPFNPNGVLGTSGSSDTIVNGYQFGASTKLGAYASNTATQVNNIKTTVARIGSAVGPIATSDQASAAISIATGGKKSPITGDMVMAASQKYGVDPATIIGVMQAETQCGTDGSTGSKQCNWGNVGNTDARMAAGQLVKMQPQQGVDAIAQNLAARKVQPGQIDPLQGTDTQPLNAQQKAQLQIKSAPLLLQPSLQSTVAGSVYLDSSKVPAGMEKLSQAYAAKNGIPYLTPSQVAIVNQTSQAMADVLHVTGPAWQEIAPTGVYDKLNNFLGHYREGYNGPDGAPTDSYVKNKTFRDNQENLAQQIRALAQAAPEIGLLQTAANALPTNGGYFTPGGTYDSKVTGNSKLQKTLDLLNEAVRTYIPNAPDVKLDDALQAPPAPGGTWTDPDGNLYKVNSDGSATRIK